MKRWMLACFALLSLLLVVASPAAMAQGNSANAKLCQKGGWESRARTEDPGTAFVSQDECVSYGAQGGKIVLYVAPTPVPPPTSVPLGTPCEEAAKLAGFNPANFTKIICGFDGPVFIESLNPGELLLGGDAGNRVNFMYGGIFIGGAGTDYIWTRMDSGTFSGGGGSDNVEGMRGGTFDGGGGNDYVYYMQNATFNGDDGDDRVFELAGGGVFNGGAGSDTIQYLASSATYTSVETVPTP